MEKPEATPTREPSFRRRLLEYFFNHLESLEQVVNLVHGYKERGINMESFWWIDPELHPLSREDLAQILNNPTFNLDLDEKREYLEKYIDFASKHSFSK